MRVDVNWTQGYTISIYVSKVCLTCMHPKKLSQLKGIENPLQGNSDQAATYQEEIRLQQAGYITKLTSEQVVHSKETWYIPHHLVQHNVRTVVYLTFHLLTKATIWMSSCSQFHHLVLLFWQFFSIFKNISSLLVVTFIWCSIRYAFSPKTDHFCDSFEEIFRDMAHAEEILSLWKAW